jgi:hypothetical protein
VCCVNESCSWCVHGRYIKAPKDTVSEEQLADQAVQKKHKVRCYTTRIDTELVAVFGNALRI